MKFIFLMVIAFLMSAQQEVAIDALLQKPFDLQKFKKTKGPSNSGLANIQPYYFKPEGQGRYFYFFLFQAPNTYTYSPNGDKKNHVRSGNGFQITTFKPNGKYKDDYFDPTETLIEVVASYNDHDLPELAFVGLDTVRIKEKLGNNFIRKDSCFIYTKNNNALVLKISEGTVQCLKYARLKTNITSVLPNELTSLTCKNQPVR